MARTFAISPTRNLTSPEDKLALARARKAAYRKIYRQNHPDQEAAARIRSAANLLTRNGWTCTPPVESTGSCGSDGDEA